MQLRPVEFYKVQRSAFLNLSRTSLSLFRSQHYYQWLSLFHCIQKETLPKEDNLAPVTNVDEID
jgi:hypothetical protein